MTLRPWREIPEPHSDVRSGNFVQAEFAADLSRVHAGSTGEEYQNPVLFFQRTFITEGMRLLLTSVGRRHNGQGGDPVIQLQTAFGGGKTHTMLAVYHLATRKCPLKELPDIPALLDQAKLMNLPTARVAVGEPVFGTGIPAGTYVSQIVSGTQIRLSQDLTANNTSGINRYQITLSNALTGNDPTLVLSQLNLDRNISSNVDLVDAINTTSIINVSGGGLAVSSDAVLGDASNSVFLNVNAATGAGLRATGSFSTSRGIILNQDKLHRSDPGPYVDPKYSVPDHDYRQRGAPPSQKRLGDTGADAAAD